MYEYVQARASQRMLHRRSKNKKKKKILELKELELNI